MKLSLALGCALVVSQAAAFAPVNSRQMSLTQQNMFSGSGAGAAPAANDEEAAQMEAAAKSMGMSVSEYQMAMQARVELAKTMDGTIVSAGNADTIAVERDINIPPKNMKITITEAGKALGQDAVSKELVAALKTTSDESKTGRAEAQKSMMAWIQEQMKE